MCPLRSEYGDSETGRAPGTLIHCGPPRGEEVYGELAGGWLLAGCSPLPIMKSILSVVPAPKENPQSGKDLGRALPIEFVELSRTESYGY